MAALTDIVEFLAEHLRLDEFEDSALNGLQIEGSAEVTKIGAAVDAGLSVFEKAAEKGVNLLLVHHGIFWQNQVPVVGARKKLLKTAIDHGISLVGVHLPLDAHPRAGNNFLLARLLELDELVPAAFHRGSYVGISGRNRKKHSRAEYVERLSKLRGCKPDFLKLEFGPEIPDRVCILSGAGADQLYQFREDRFDTLVSGEPKQFAYHFCRENNLNAFFAGHYATETLGVEAVAKELAQKFSIEWEFIDEPTGI